jgi:hypothetical protein
LSKYQNISSAANYDMPLANCLEDFAKIMHRADVNFVEEYFKDENDKVQVKKFVKENGLGVCLFVVFFTLI